MTYGYRQRVDAEVIALGAWCDLVSPETSTASPGGTSFEVHEFAIMNDGRRLTLHTDRGFTSWVQASYPAGQKPSVEPDPWAFITRERVESDIRTTVLPDDEDSQDEHPYGWLAELLRRLGVDVTEEQLRRLPYQVEFSDRLERRLARSGIGAQ